MTEKSTEDGRPGRGHALRGLWPPSRRRRSVLRALRAAAESCRSAYRAASAAHDLAGHAGNGRAPIGTPLEPPPVAPGPAAGPPPWTTAGVQPEAPTARGAQAQADTTGSWPMQPGYGAPPPPPGYPAAYAGAYPASPERKTSTGLIVGLVVAAIAAVGLIVAIVLLATSSGSQPPAITTTATQASANVTPVSPSAGTAVQTSGAGRGAAGNPATAPTTRRLRPDREPVATRGGDIDDSGVADGERCRRQRRTGRRARPLGAHRLG